MILEFPNVEGSGELYLDVMRAICGDTAGKSMVDLMCHKAPYTPQLGFKERTYVDIQFRGMDFKEEIDRFIECDVLEFLSTNKKKYDVAICSDGIEHFKKGYGGILFGFMLLRSEKAIIFTPLGDCNITDDDNPDRHKSGWTPEDFKNDAVIVFPDFHKSMNQGAFFAWFCGNIKEDFERVKNELNNKTWNKVK